MLMSTTISKPVAKKGGPYTKKEQEVRRNEVFRLHFELGHSAVKIADLIKVNRNTINTDINFWYSQFTKSWQENDVNCWIMKQLQRLESQKSRLHEELDKQETLTDKLLIEKLLFDIDNKIAQIITKLVLNQEKFVLPDGNEIIEDDIEEFVRTLVKKKNYVFKSCNFSEDEILYEAIKLEKCDMNQARKFFQEMMDLGLGLCDDENHDYDRYNLLKFCIMRGYVTKEELPVHKK